MPAPAVTAAARRAKRVIDSSSSSSSVNDQEDIEDVEEVDEAEAEPELEDEEGADDAGEEEDDDDDELSEDPLDVIDSEADVEDEDDSPKPSLKLKFRVGSGSATKAKPKGGKKRERSESAEFETESRATSPSKMTARQRARAEGGDDGGLMSLPDGQFKAKPELTEAERLQKREEMARRRKRQNEQRLQDEQDQTINRLLRAQTGRSRSKLDGPDDTSGSARASGVSSPVKRAELDGVRYVSRLDGEKLVVQIAVRPGREDWIALPEHDERKIPPQAACSVKGCGQPRKYRCVKAFEKGGCSLPHLKEVEARL